MREYARESESVVSRVRGEPIRAFEGRPFQACPCEVNKCPQRSPKKSATTTLETSDSSRACSHSLQPGLQEGKYDLRSSEPAGASNGWRDYKYKIRTADIPTLQENFTMGTRRSSATDIPSLEGICKHLGLLASDPEDRALARPAILTYDHFLREHRSPDKCRAWLASIQGTHSVGQPSGNSRELGGLSCSPQRKRRWSSCLFLPTAGRGSCRIQKISR